MTNTADDFHAQLKKLYHTPPNQFVRVDVPELRYFTVDGQGDPDQTDIPGITKWLYSVVHVTKPVVLELSGKKFPGYPPLEFLFWADNPQDFVAGNKDKWHWRVMLVCGDFLPATVVEDAINQVENKRGPLSCRPYLAHLHEGKCVQYLHVGDYGGVASVCEQLYGEYLPQNQLTPNGYYHEIYLNDPTRAAPKKRKILIRQPVTRLGH